MIESNFKEMKFFEWLPKWKLVLSVLLDFWQTT